MLYQLMSNDLRQRTATKHAKRGLCNISENENNWTLDILAPGFEKSEIMMDLKDGVLNVSATKENDPIKFLKKEFRATNIDRTFTLPKNAATENISAKLNAGILSIVIPKNEQAKPKTINIK